MFCIKNLHKIYNDSPLFKAKRIYFGLMRVLLISLLFCIQCFSLPCEFSLVTKETKGINLPVFENSLENFRSSSFEELMIFTLRDKAGNAKADKLQKEELVAYSNEFLPLSKKSRSICKSSCRRFRGKAILPRNFSLRTIGTALWGSISVNLSSYKILVHSIFKW